MTEKEEKAFLEGAKAFVRQVLSLAMRELREDGAERPREYLVKERSETLALLREEIAHVGGDQPSDDLHLRDVVEKCLLRVVRWHIVKALSAVERGDVVVAAETLKGLLR